MVNTVVAPGVRKNASGKGVSTAAAVAVLTYTVAANKAAEITAWFDDAVNVAVALQFELVIGGSTFRPNSTLGAGNRQSERIAKICLASGDVARWIVSTAIAATTADVFMSIVEEV